MKHTRRFTSFQVGILLLIGLPGLAAAGDDAEAPAAKPAAPAIVKAEPAVEAEPAAQAEPAVKAEVSAKADAGSAHELKRALAAHGITSVKLPKEAAEARKEAMKAYRSAEQALHAARQAQAAGGEDAAKLLAEAKSAAKEARKEANVAIRKAQKARVLNRADVTPEMKKEMKEKLHALREARKESRPERAEEKRAAIKKAYKEDKLKTPALQGELTRHAWRVARLEQLIVLAEAAGRDDVKERAEKLLARESKKHDARMAHIATGAPLPADYAEAPELEAEGSADAAVAAEEPAAVKEETQPAKAEETDE